MGDKLVTLYVNELEALEDVRAYTTKYDLHCTVLMDDSGIMGIEYQFFSPPQVS
jgi:hypothetical protein